ncbi:nucleotide sugar dehydrogenase [Terriglobus roseus DSM 18391]|uniref:UDP-glucose 6-dehydrogenase n=1 Tax=Terriglobus roseus (strain DSM 18391 / NRRL B-41598 / KBS 63) TaxID=926566 RepID=I3ZFG1_TERRK|nr:UDP-glucose/GDP-mannose dehydrogenase family protein [Terriglobus roseus]AFL87979.1 nucleotide sugar dehydrogenase [Terriglobus roseus DSM 18391]
MQKKVRITVVGSGYVGLVAAACFAEIGHDVICVDNDQSKIDALKGGACLIHEEFLPELLDRHRNGRLQFSANLAEATAGSDAIFIAVGTPQSDTGDADLSYVEAVASEIARHLTHYTVIVEKSTVPVYTNEWIRRTLERNGVERGMFDVVSNPEFLREGTAVRDFLHPDRIVVGSDKQEAADVLSAIYAPLTDGTYFDGESAIPGPLNTNTPAPILHTSTKSAEIIKHASNAFLALKISFINAVSNLCEATDANVEQVASGMGLDSRIGGRFLRPGIGYGGSCFPKDVAAFRSVADALGVDFSLLREVESINIEQQKRFLRKIRSALWTLRGKKLGVLGLAFKGGTDDIRDSPAIALIQMLIEEGCTVCAFDPAGMERAHAVLPVSATMSYAADAYEAAMEADALLILTDWDEFCDLDLNRIKLNLRYPTVLDGRNLFDPKTVSGAGLTYVSVGRPTAHPIREHAVKQTA